MSSRKRLVCVGASGFGAQCAELARGIPGVELAGIVTAPRQFAISYSEQPVTNVLHADFEKLAQAATRNRYVGKSERVKPNSDARAR